MALPKYYFAFLILCVILIFNSVFQIVSAVPLGTISSVYESGSSLSAGTVFDIFRQKAVWMKSEITGPAGIIMGVERFGVRDFIFGVLGLITVSGLIRLKKWAVYVFIFLLVLDFILSVIYLKKPVSNSIIRSLAFQYSLYVIMSIYLIFQRKAFV